MILNAAIRAASPIVARARRPRKFRRRRGCCFSPFARRQPQDHVAIRFARPAQIFELVDDVRIEPNVALALIGSWRALVGLGLDADRAERQRLGSGPPLAACPSALGWGRGLGVELGEGGAERVEARGKLCLCLVVQSRLHGIAALCRFVPSLVLAHKSLWVYSFLAAIDKAKFSSVEKVLSRSAILGERREN